MWCGVVQDVKSLQEDCDLGLPAVQNPSHQQHILLVAMLVIMWPGMRRL